MSEDARDENPDLTDESPDLADESPDLTELAATVTAPDTAAAEAAARRLGVPPAPRAPGPTGQLGRLATWWAGVSGRDPADAPGAVVHVRPPQVPPRTGAPGTVRTVELAPPPDVPAAVGWGAARADALADEGIDLVLLGLGDPVAARVLAAHLLGLDPVEANGWPQDGGVDDGTWMQRTTAVRDGLRRVRGLRRQPGKALVAVADGGCAAATALLLRCSARRTPVLLDGPGAAAVALLARRAAPAAASWWRAAHLTRHPVHAKLLDALQLDPLLRLDIGAEDGTGPFAALALLELAAGLPATEGTGPTEPGPTGSAPTEPAPDGTDPKRPDGTDPK